MVELEELMVLQYHRYARYIDNMMVSTRTYQPIIDLIFRAPVVIRTAKTTEFIPKPSGFVPLCDVCNAPNPEWVEIQFFYSGKRIYVGDALCRKCMVDRATYYTRNNLSHIDDGVLGTAIIDKLESNQINVYYNRWDVEEKVDIPPFVVFDAIIRTIGYVLAQLPHAKFGGYPEELEEWFEEE